MCLTIPGKVIEIKTLRQARGITKKALLKTASGVRQVNIGLLSGVKVGDWLLATTDLAVKKIKTKDAGEILELLSGQKITDTRNVSPKFRNILQNAQIKVLTKDEIVYLLKTDGHEKEALFSEADAARKENLKDFICLHAIIEFSNHCANNCFYCGLRRDNETVSRYRMSIPEIVKVANEAVNKIGYKMLVLQSGVDKWYTDEMLVELVKKIKAKCRCFIFMSAGERSVECYKKIKQAGANGVLFRFETSNQKLYDKMHPRDTLKGGFWDGVRGSPRPNHSLIPSLERRGNLAKQAPHSPLEDGLQNRLALLKEMKKMGYYISSGPIIGLPGQTIEDLADDILMMKKLGVGMVSMGPFIPSDNTPLSREPRGDVELSLKMIAVSRLVMPKSRIPVTTALETLDPENARKRGSQGGANSLMFNLTPAKYRSKYKIYPNKFHGRDKDLEDFALYKGKESWEMLEREFKKYLK
jgi:biotin synthase